MNIFGQGATGPAGMPLTREMTQGGEQRTFVGQEPFIPAAMPTPVQEPTTATYLSPDESRTRFAEFLPIEATPNDTLLPSDDPRVYTYQTPNGNIYYLPAFEEQLQERRSVGEVVNNLIDAVPSRTEVEDALLNAPRAVYDSIRRQVTGQGTYGDIINTAGGMVGLNGVPRSRFVDEILDETPAVGPDDYWDGVVENTFRPVIRLDDSYRGAGEWRTSMPAEDAARYPFGTRTTAQSQIDDMVATGVVRPPPGGYQGEAIMYFGGHDSPVPTSIFNRPNPSKPYTIVARSDVVAGRTGPITLDELQHVWTYENGELVDILPDLIRRNIEYQQGYYEGGLVTQTRQAFGGMI